MRFKSKTFVTPSPVSFGWISVDAKAYPVSVKVFADGNVIANYAIGLTIMFTVWGTQAAGLFKAYAQEPVVGYPQLSLKSGI